MINLFVLLRALHVHVANQSCEISVNFTTRKNYGMWTALHKISESLIQAAIGKG